MTNELIDFIHTVQELIDNDEWHKVFQRCPISLRAELKKVLKSAKIDFSFKIDSAQYMQIDAASKFVQKFIKDLGITYDVKYNDKGKTGRKLKYEMVNIPASITDIEETIRQELDNNNILYDFVKYDSELYRSRSGWHPYAYDALVVRLLDPEVVR